MPKYDFKCQSIKGCGHVEEYTFPMAVIVDVPCVTCAVCGRDATRMFTMPQLITEPIHLSEAFRIDPETDGLEARHKQDKAYEDSWKPAPQEEIDKDNLEREQLVKSYA